jgi:hypothetical protein
VSILLAVAYFATTLLLHAIWCRVSARPAVVVKFVAVGGVAGLALLAHLLSVEGLTYRTLAGLLVFALASELYIFCFTLIISSVSAIWLRRLYRGSIESEELAEAYSPTWMVELRLDRLVENGFLARDGDGYRLTEKGRNLIGTFGKLRAIFKHERRPSQTI